jgi:hypothetical protein
MTKLYRVRTVVSEFKGHRDVSLDWFVIKRTSSVQRPYAEMIAGYDPAKKDLYSEDAIDELFSDAEARSFVDWLKANRPEGSNMIAEVALPIPENCMGFGAIAVGGPQDFLEFELDGALWPLEFTVMGYFDLRAHEPIDKSVPPRHAFCSIYVFGDKIVHDYDALLGLWRAGKIVAADETPPVASASL